MECQKAFAQAFFDENWPLLNASIAKSIRSCLDNALIFKIAIKIASKIVEIIGFVTFAIAFGWRVGRAAVSWPARCHGRFVVRLR